jgi:transposase-like protein
MKKKNKYVNRAKITEVKTRQLIRCFALDLNATQIAELTKLNRNTVNRYVMEIRKRAAEYCESASPVEKGEVEVDESCFGPRRVRGKRGRGAGAKTIVFGLFKRAGKARAEVVPNCQSDTLQEIIRGRVSPETVIHSDGWRGYDGLAGIGYQKRYRVNHSGNEFANGSNHINGIESFWGFAKHRLVKFHGVAKRYFYLHLKECEFRFNARGSDIYHLLLDIIRNHPLF